MIGTLCEKYRANCFADLKGQEQAISRAENFIKKFPETKALILQGPAGTGKTALAYSLASEFNAEVIEVNASDFRDKANVDRIIGQASKQASLISKNKIILVDEVDGISTEDRGGLPELIKIIEETGFPIIMTANNIWDKKFSDLRKRCELLEIKELNYRTVVDILKEIALKEKIEITEDLITSIAILSKGDVRAALNDLQSINSETLNKDLSERDKEEKIFDVMKKIFKNIPNDETLELYDKLNMPLDEIFLWIEENIPLEYKAEELAKAFDALSRADVFKGRVHRQQHWRFLIYQNILLSAGISAAKKRNKLGYTMYKRPSRVLKIWMINQKNIYKKSIAQKFAKFCHIGVKRAMHEFPVMKPILKDPSVQQKLKLSVEEIEFLEK